MASEITIAAPFVRNACAGARRAGYDVDTQLRSSGIRPSLLAEDRSRIPVDDFVILLRRLMWLMDDECLGLLEYPQRLGSFALTARSALHEKSLIDAMQVFVEAANLLSRGLIHEISIKGKSLRYNLRRREGAVVYSPYIIESTLITAHRFFCWLGRIRIHADLAELDYPAPPYAAEYRHLFYGAPVRFNAEYGCLHLQAPDTDAQLRRSLQDLEAYIEAAPSDIFTPLSTRQLSLQARQIILEWFESNRGMPTSRQCAKSLNIAGQSFWRRLHREGTDYRTLRSEVRRDLALKLLREDELSIEAIASKTGYSESSAFIRAFRNWTGFTPLAYRKLSR